MLIFRLFRALAAGALVSLAAAVCAAQDVPPAAPDVQIDHSVRIATRDGIRLGGVTYRPAATKSRLPTILAMTPYMVDSWHERAMYFARHGYNVVVVDQRGRGNSEGSFVPWEDDGRDGYDTVEWIARQPWSDGQVGMIGGSYSGANQWATLREGPPALKTIVPTASPFFGYDFPAHKGIFDVWLLNWYQGTYARVMDTNFRDDYSYFTPVVREHYLAGRAYAGIDDALGMPMPLLDRWLAHPSVDGYWRSLVPDAKRFASIDVPILTITGQFDGVQLGSLEYYNRQLAAGGLGAERHYLLIGPWNHSGTRKPKSSFGGLDVGQAAVIDIDALHVEWFDWTMKKGPRPAFLADKVTYYVTGAGAWRHAPTLAAIPTIAQRLYLTGPGGASIATPARLTPTPSTTPLRYVYDPRNMQFGRNEPSYSDNVLLDTYLPDHLLGGALLYQSAPLAAARVITGRPKLQLRVMADVPDSDIEATLYEIERGGRSIKLGSDRMRLRYRDSLERPVPMPKGKWVTVTLGDFPFVSRRLAAGSTLRLVVGAPRSIFTQKNWNGGGDVGRETIADARTAHIALDGFIDLPMEK